MKTYEKYKESDSQWINEVPLNWEIASLNHLVEFIMGQAPHSDSYNMDGQGEVFIKTGDFGILRPTIKWYTTSPLVFASENDVFICVVGATSGKVNLGVNGTISRSIAALSPKSRLLQKYLYYYLSFNYERLNDAAQGSAQGIINKTILSNIKVPIPPIAEQTAIARYLDHQTAIIDQLIQQKEKLIELLKLKRQAVINEAVTKGLDPSAPMKDSGIEWLGEVPEKWSVTKLKFIIDELESGVSVNSDNVPIDFETKEIAVLKTSCVFNYSFNPEENKKVVDEEYDRVKCPVRGNSIIISRMNTPELVGASGYVDKDYPNLFLPDRLWQTVINKKAEVDVEFISYILKTDIYRGVFSTIATGSSPSMKNIAQNSLLNLTIPYPPLNEQKIIKEYLRSFNSRLSESIKLMGDSIDKLKEYRQSIISEAVTGKVDVRGKSQNLDLQD